jgi:putative ABC transport system permease protein
VVGLVRDFHSTALRRPMVEELYVPYSQLPLSALTLMARTKSEPAAIAPAVRNEIWNLNRNQPIHGIQTMESLIANATSSERTNSILVGSFALLALILTAIGVYGVLSHMVEQRTSEIGIRMALGALEGDVLRQFLLQAVRLAAIGCVTGVLGAFALRRGLETLLFGVKATNPWVLGGVALFVVAVAVMAAWVPAQRAVRVDPAIALRRE